MNMTLEAEIKVNMDLEAEIERKKEEAKTKAITNLGSWITPDTYNHQPKEKKNEFTTPCGFRCQALPDE